MRKGEAAPSPLYRLEEGESASWVGWEGRRRVSSICTAVGGQEVSGGPLVLWGGWEAVHSPCAPIHSLLVPATAVAPCGSLLSGAWSLQHNWLLLLGMEVRKCRESQACSSLTPPAAMTSHSYHSCGTFCPCAPVLPCPGELHGAGCPMLQDWCCHSTCFFYGDSGAIQIKDINVLWTMTAG